MGMGGREMIKQTKQQRANTIDALENMWPSVPPENVSPGLLRWRADSYGTRFTPGKVNCGTVACFGGWCTHWPAFTAQGVLPRDVDGSPMFDAVRADRYLFGDDWIFYPRNDHPADPGYYELELDTRITDHELVTRRLKWLLENSEVVE